MSNNLEAIRDGLFLTLVTHGPYSSGQISACGFDVLEGSNTCAVTFYPGGESQFEPQGYDVDNERHDTEVWTIDGSIWIKDTGDPQALLGKVWRAPHDLKQTINRDTSLGGSCSDATVRWISVDVENEYEAAGQAWQRIRFRLEATVA